MKKALISLAVSGMLWAVPAPAMAQSAAPAPNYTENVNVDAKPQNDTRVAQPPQDYSNRDVQQEHQAQDSVASAGGGIMGVAPLIIGVCILFYMMYRGWGRRDQPTTVR